MKKISAIIIVKNEEKLIEECLRSIVWVDEIILIDAESEDKTLEIAKNYTDKIFIKKWQGFSEQKKYALSLTKNHWVLNVDADERISNELKNEILNLDFLSDGYFIRRENYFLNKIITTCGWGKDFQLRLFNKSKTTVTEKLVHEGFVVDGKISYLKNPMKHYTFLSIEKSLSKINNYSTLQAAESYKNKSRVSGIKIISHGFSAFFRYYFSLKGFKDGIYGLIISFFNSISTILTYVKIWELQNSEKEISKLQERF